MNSNKDFSDLFDENFEITYENEPGDFSEISRSTGTDRQNRRAVESQWDEYENEDEDRIPRQRRAKSSKKKAGGVHLAAPIQKGGRTLSRVSGILIRQLSLILILAVSAYVLYTFWRASVPYGDIMESLGRKSFSPTLLAYLSIPAVFLIFELISFFWALTKVRNRDADGIWKEDRGRGLTSFLITFAASYLAFLLNRLVPATPDFLYGLKGALLVYGSMHNTLLGLCAAGVISCLVRRYLAR